MTLANLVVFHRGLGSSDESATDEEQGEKILYYYPEDTSLYNQLSRMNLLEGLVDFSSRFSSEPIDVVVMKHMTYSFVLCEPDLWIVIGINNSELSDKKRSASSSSATSQGNGNDLSKFHSPSHPSSASPSSSMHSPDSSGANTTHSKSLGDNQHVPNSTGMIDSITRMYKAFTTIFGDIGSLLSDRDNTNDKVKGWDVIRQVQKTRRRLRKLDIQLKQQVLDWETLKSISKKTHSSNGESEDAKDDKEEDVEGNRDEEVVEQEEGDGMEGEVVDKEEEEERKNDESPDQEYLGIKEGTKSLEESEKELAETRAEIAENEVLLNQLLDSGNYTVHRVHDLLQRFLRWWISSGELMYPSALHGMVGIHYAPVGHPAFQSLLRVRQSAQVASRGLCEGCIIIHDGQVTWSDLDDETTFMIYDFIRLQEMTYLRAALQNASLLSQQRGEESLTGMGVGGGGGGHNSSDATTNATNIHSLRQAEEDWATRMLNRKGFIINNWETKDLDESVYLPPEAAQGRNTRADNPEGKSTNLNGQKFSTPSSNRNSMHNHTTSRSEHQNEAEDSIFLYHCQGPEGIWCPRIFACDSRKGKAKKYDKRMEDVGLALGHSFCVGRALVYKQGRSIVVLVLPDWSELVDSSLFNPLMHDTANDINDKAGDDHGGHADISMHESEVIIEDLKGVSNDSYDTYSSTDKKPCPHSDSDSDSDNYFMSICCSLQRSLSPELEELSRAIEAAAAEANSGNNVGTQSSLPSKKPHLPEGVRLVYFNSCNRAIKAADLYRIRFDPLTIWPKLVTSGSNNVNTANSTPSHSPAGLSMHGKGNGGGDNLHGKRNFNNNNNNNSNSNSNHASTSSTGPSSLPSSPMPWQPLLSTNPIISDVRPRFPLSPALLTGGLDPSVVRALNDLRETLSCRHSRGYQVTEACLRVKSVRRGGLWVVGRRLGDRMMLLIVEGRGTLTDMYEQVMLTTDGILQQVML